MHAKDRLRDPAILLAQDRWLRLLARSLVADSHAAEDLAQEAWLAVLLRRPAGASIHAWLRATLAKMASKMRRGEARRLERERRAARPSELPSDAELRERENARRAVFEAVFALEEPHRATIVLRFLDGLPPRAIAMRMGVPVATVRTRVRRGLELLRERLDREHGGERAAWRAVLVPLARPEAALPGLAAALAGVLLVTTKTKLAVAALACAALSLLLWRLLPGPAAADAEAAGRPAAAAPATTSQPARRAEAEALAPAAATRSAVAAPSRPETGSLLVRVLWAEGSRPAERITAVVLPRDADEPMFHEREAATDALGEARFERLPPGNAMVRLDRGRSKEATVVPGTEATVMLTLAPGVDVQGRVTDAHGAGIAGAEVLLTDSYSTHERGRVAARTAPDGTFAMSGVPSGCRLEARADRFAPSPRQTVRGAAGATERVEIVLAEAGGSLACTVRDERGRAVEGALVQVGDPVREFTQLKDGTPAPLPSVPRLRTDRDGNVRFVGLAEGTHVLRARAPGMAPFSGEASVSALRETSRTIDLVPGVTVRGTVLDARGSPVAKLLLSVGVTPNESGRLEATTATTRADGSYALFGLAPGTIDVLAGSELMPDKRGAAARTRLIGHPGATLRWDVRLGPSLAIRGRVVDARGGPVAKVRVSTGSGFVAFTSTDAEGRFELACPKDIPTLVLAHPSERERFPRAWVENVRPGPQELVITLDDSRAPSVHIRGALLDAAGKPYRGGRAMPSHALLGVGVPGDVDPETGRFQFGPLPAGVWRVQYVLDRKYSKITECKLLAPHETWDLGEVRIAPPGSLRITARRRDGKAIPRVACRVQAPDGTFFGSSELRDGSGLASDVPPGRVLLLLNVPGCATACVACEVVSGKEGKVDLDLVPGVRTAVRFEMPGPNLEQYVHATVRDAKGAVVVDEWVLGERDSGKEWAVALIPGKYRIEGSTRNGWRGEAEIEVGAGPAGDSSVVELR